MRDTMPELFGGLVAVCLALGGCFTPIVPPTKPPPVLAPTGTVPSNVTYLGGVRVAGDLYVCRLDTGEALTCIPYVLFQEELQKQGAP